MGATIEIVYRLDGSDSESYTELRTNEVAIIPEHFVGSIVLFCEEYLGRQWEILFETSNLKISNE